MIALRFLILIALSFCVPSFAEAHIVAGSSFHGGAAAGFAHPFTGLDHMLAMIAVGIWAAMMGGRSVWLMPAAFIGMMIVGGIAGIYGLGASSFETGIALSVVALGFAVAMAWNPSPVVGAVLCGLFALFHGHAHGIEMSQALSPVSYSAGFVVATALLHAMGIGLAFSMRRANAQACAWAGGCIALVGVALLLV